MSSSYRIRTELGVNKTIQVKLEQNYDTLELLSLTISPNNLYTRACADYGVVCGRVFSNNGFGLPNAKLSIFIPVEELDIRNEEISVLYPYQSINDVNEDGYRYNLLPYTQSHSGHVPVGTFPDRIDALINKTVIEVYDKYYRFTVSTNDSGDFMILGVPTGQQTLFMQVDLSDIGEFSMTPQDLIRMGLATESQVDGTRFKFSENYNELPQIISISKTIQVSPLYGEPEICDYAIQQVDFDLTSEKNVTISPTAVFIGSIFSADDGTKVTNTINDICNVKRSLGEMCDLTSGPGQILALRQTIRLDNFGLPIIEQFALENDGKIIDEDGTWVTEVPMNLDYVYTDEEGNRRISDNPNIGIPTKSKYRFKVKWEQPPQISESTKRAYFLIPNVKEYGWTYNPSNPNDPGLEDFVYDTVTVEIAAGTTEANIYNLINENVATQYVFILQETINVENLQITYPDGTPYLSRNFSNNFIGGLPNLILSWETPDTETSSTFIFYAVIYKRFLLDASYAFSLSWNDYANYQEAINCEDTFMELHFNKVYTISQLIDRYSTGLRPSKTVQIKNIQDPSCGGTNKFPINDVFVRINFAYIFNSFLLDVFKWILLVTTVILHVVSFLWLIIALVIATVLIVVQLIIFIICNIIRGLQDIFGAASINCPPPSDFRSLLFDNPFRNITLPLLLYTEDGCERCNCNPGDVTADTNLITEFTQTQEEQVSILMDTTGFQTYTNNPNDFTYIPNLIAGNAGLSGVEKRIPKVTDSYNIVTDPDAVARTIVLDYYSQSLPFSERLNMLSFPGRYFKVGTANDPLGIKVYIEPELNTPIQSFPYWDATTQTVLQQIVVGSPKFHWDNALIIALDPGIDLTVGEILSFQNPSLSNDPNYKKNEDYPASLGRIEPPLVQPPPNTLGGFGAQITVNWLRTYNFINLGNGYQNPNGPINGTEGGGIAEQTTYNVSAITENNAVTSFAADIEYFQVLKVGNLNDLSSSSIDSVLNQNQYFRHQESSEGGTVSCFWQRANYYGSGFGFPSLGNNLVTPNGYKYAILMRGVDVHSPRVKQKIWLGSLLYNQISESNIPVGVSESDVYVEGYFKLNIPYQPNNLSSELQQVQCRHNQLQTNNSVDEFGSRIFYPSYMFDYYSTTFIPFTSDLHLYYSSYDAKNFGNQVPPEYSDSSVDGYVAYQQSQTSFINGLERVSNLNIFTGFFSNIQECGQGTSGSNNNDCDDDSGSSFPQQSVDTWNLYNQYPNSNSQLDFPGNYRIGQVVEGGSVYQYSLSLALYDSPCQSNGGNSNGLKLWTAPKMAYFSPSYRTITSPGTTYPTVNFSNKNRIVVRSNRMPTSTNEQISGPNSFQLHQNSTFAIYRLSDTGGVQELQNITQYPTNSDNESANAFVPFTNVLESVNNCEKAVMLTCYGTDENGNPIIKDDCPQMMDPDNPVKYFNYGTGCYNLVSRSFTSLPFDLGLITEWTNRNKISNAACLGVFSHSFSNNWINGTLFAYPFENKRFFDSENQPYSVFCKSLIYLQETSSNFYYRSSAWDGQIFIGKTSKQFYETQVGNERYLGNPTTIMDLGPKDTFIQELVNTDEYDGYIVSKVPSTSYKDISEIFNLFILSRLVNNNFIENLLISILPEIVMAMFFTNKRWGAFSAIPAYVDGDYSQMLSINSEFGISEFTVSNYAQPVDSGFQAVYFGGSAAKPLFGIFLTGNTQDRDYITPRRTIWNPNASINQNPDYYFSQIPVKTQTVPFYQWKLDDQNYAEIDQFTIFGNQNNNWVTKPLYSPFSFFSFGYQNLDRINPASNYFQPDGNNSNYFRGTLINFANGTPTIVLPQTFSDSTSFVVGAPQHFYFGLVKGGSAIDKFRIKYVNTELIIE
jgi:hypothetical protein